MINGKTKKEVGIREKKGKIDNVGKVRKKVRKPMRRNETDYMKIFIWSVRKRVWAVITKQDGVATTAIEEYWN